jgi:hypothetical protein
MHKQVLKGTRWLLLKNPENLDPKEVFSKGVFWLRGKRRRILLVELVSWFLFISWPNEGWKDTP